MVRVAGPGADLVRGVSGARAAGAELIAVDHLSKVYAARTGLVTALEDIDFAVDEG